MAQHHEQPIFGTLADGAKAAGVDLLSWACSHNSFLADRIVGDFEPVHWNVTANSPGSIDGLHEVPGNPNAPEFPPAKFPTVAVMGLSMMRLHEYVGKVSDSVHSKRLRIAPAVGRSVGKNAFVATEVDLETLERQADISDGLVRAAMRLGRHNVSMGWGAIARLPGSITGSKRFFGVSSILEVPNEQNESLKVEDLGSSEFRHALRL